MRPRIRAVFLAAATVLVLFVLNDGQALASHVSCGDTITQDTTLDSDLIDCPGDGLVIGADNITLDLHGHVIDAALHLDGISFLGVSNVGHEGTTIENGTVRDFGLGIRLDRTNSSVLRQLTVSGYSSIGIYLYNSSRNRVETSSLTGQHGFSDGIVLTFADRNQILSNSVQRNSGPGIGLHASRGNLIQGNTLRDNQNVGIALGGAVILRGPAAGHQIFGSHDNHVESNDVSLSRYGIQLSGLPRPSNDRSRTERNHIDGNSLIYNRFGIDFASSNDTVVEGNFLYFNTIDGIGTDEFPGKGYIGNLVKGNDASQNGDDGIDIDGPGTTLTGNTATYNVDFGIEAVPDVIDGGGNQAFGNGNPLQCLNVVCK